MDDAKFNLLLNELKNICIQIDERFDKVDEKFEQIDKRFEQIDKRFDTLEKNVNSLSKEVGALNRTFFQFETDSQSKINLLLNSDNRHTDKELILERQLCRLSDNLENTTLRVSFLENSSVNS